MLNLPNSLSLLRAPLAFLFIIENTAIRITAIILAMVTDCIDGYFARRYHYMSRIGAILDPIMDKVFVYTVLTVLVYESQITPLQIVAILTRDLFLILFILYLLITGGWKKREFKAIRWGKVSTAAQFITLIALTLKIPFPFFFYYAFVLFGFLAFIEMLQVSKKLPSH